VKAHGGLHHSHITLDDDAAFDEPTERNYLDDLNRDSKRVIEAYIEPALKRASGEDRFQFERHGYFVADAKDHSSAHPVFNRTVTLRDSWVRAISK